jgi:hypothetical protein
MGCAHPQHPTSPFFLKRYKIGVFVASSLGGNLLYTLSHPLRIESAYVAPEFVTVPIEIDKGRGKFKPINWGQFAPNVFLDIETDKKDLVSKFIFELVHDGLYFGAANSVGGLELQ